MSNIKLFKTGKVRKHKGMEITETEYVEQPERRPCKQCKQNVRARMSSKCQACIDKKLLLQAKDDKLQRKIDQQINN